MKKTSNLAIVGGGPRGLSALENLVTQIVKTNKTDFAKIWLFEATDLMGSGHVIKIVD